jgi:hypothetical protein
MRLVSGGKEKFGGGESCLSYFSFTSGIWFGVLGLLVRLVRVVFGVEGRGRIGHRPRMDKGKGKEEEKGRGKKEEEEEEKKKFSTMESSPYEGAASMRL